MSDPRMIPADEAKNIQALFSSFGNPSNRERKIRDLAATVVAQAAQIERVREALSWIEGAENRAHDDWIRTADTHHRDAALAYTQTVTWLRYALGDTDG